MMKTEEALAMIGGHVDEELLLRNEYLAAENEILRRKIQGRIELSNTERIRLAKIGGLVHKCFYSTHFRPQVLSFQ